MLIPVWPGTNCELDTARVFELAGAVPEIQVVNNLSPAGIEDTIERIAKGVDNAQILMLPDVYKRQVRRPAPLPVHRNGGWP